MKLALAATLLAAAANAAEVAFFLDRDCNEDSRMEQFLEVPDESGNVEHAYFENDKPVSMRVIGYATVLLTEENSSKFDQKTCPYCANYYTDAGRDCAVDDGVKCVNINVGWGPSHAELIAIGDPSPADLPCRNFANRCDFNTPPSNGFCEQI